MLQSANQIVKSWQDKALPRGRDIGSGREVVGPQIAVCFASERRGLEVWNCALDDVSLEVVHLGGG
jgi:hypothetical protein